MNMKKFVITTNQNPNDVMKKILSECRVSGQVSPEIEKYLGTLEDGSKTYKCVVSGNKLTVEMPMPYRNSFVSKMNLEILTAGENTQINGSISSPFSGTASRRIFIMIVLLVLLGFLVIQAIRFFTATASFFDWLFIPIATFILLSYYPVLFTRQKDESDPLADDPYGIQMNHWISNLFPGECRVTKK